MSSTNYSSIQAENDQEGRKKMIGSEAIEHSPSHTTHKRGVARLLLGTLSTIVLMGLFSKIARPSNSNESGATTAAAYFEMINADLTFPYHKHQNHPFYTSWTWYNDPLHWAIVSEEGDLYVKVPSKSDYWENTYYPEGKGGYQADSAPFYHTTYSGNFVATVKFTGRYINLYDQAGIMVRVDAKNWMKCGIEYTSGQHASTVITRDGYSDWSILAVRQQRPRRGDPVSIYFQVKRIGGAILTYYSFDGIEFTKIRMGFLTDEASVQIGLVAAAPSPEGDGFEVIFSNFELLPLSDEEAAHEE
eukprot:scaffold2462_cov127-Cylindrotheca_fusiformis.AAC.8